MSLGRALVVGAPGGTLRGVEHDARAMAALLEARGMAVDLRIGATRASIIDGYQTLISSAVRDAPAVFYFAGHGFRGQLEGAPGAMWQGIVPVDLSESTDNDFRGVTSVELSILQTRLSERTRNVTTILDCCFASQMSRVFTNAGAVRSLPHPARLGFAAHVQSLRSRYGALADNIDALSNKDAIRVVACGASECASEARWPDGSPGGALTIALAMLLDEVGHSAITWAVFSEALRHRVQRQWPTQRPEIEGPVRRELFSLRESRSEAIGATLAGDGAWLHAGRVAGVAVGDIYGVMPLGANSYQPQAVLSTLEIRSVRAMSADGVLSPPPKTLAREALAFVIKKALEPRLVAISGTLEEVRMMESAIMQTPGLLRAEIGSPGNLANVHITASQISIEDVRGRVCVPFSFPSEIGAAVLQLVQLAVAQDIRELEGAYGVQDEEVEVEWGVVENGAMRPLSRHGATLGISARPYVRIGNRSSRRLYAHVLGVGLCSEISVLTSQAPSGVELRNDRPDFVLGQDPSGRLCGMSLAWSPGVPCDSGPRLDELIVIITAARGDLRMLEKNNRARSMLHSMLGLGPALLRNASSFQDTLWVRRFSFALEPIADHIIEDAP